MKIPKHWKHIMWEAVSVALKWSRFTAVWWDQIQTEAPDPGTNPGSATIRKHDIIAKVDKHKGVQFD